MNIRITRNQNDDGVFIHDIDSGKSENVLTQNLSVRSNSTEVIQSESDLASHRWIKLDSGSYTQ